MRYILTVSMLISKELDKLDFFSGSSICSLFFKFSRLIPDFTKFKSRFEGGHGGFG